MTTKKISITDALLALNALEDIYPRLKPHAKYQVDCVRAILTQSIEIARPLATGDEKKDQWLSIATTLPFEPLVLTDVFAGIKKIEPVKFLALKRLCVEASPLEQ
jgi:hypothetical protein